MDQCVKTMSTLFIIGGQSTALEIRETVELLNCGFENILNVVANDESCQYSFIQDRDLDAKLEITNKIYFIIGFTNIKLKNKYRTLFRERGGIEYSVLHPQSYIARSAVIGKGVYVAAFADVSTNSVIGDGCIINYQVTIGHDSIIGEDCTFNPGAKIGGHSKIEKNCLLGANSFVLQGLHIAHDTKVDALTYVNTNIDEPSVCKSKSEFQRVRNLYVKQ